MFKLGNIDKFLDDHPEIKELQDRRLEIMKNARIEGSKGGGMLVSGVANDLLGTHAKLFFEELSSDIEHIKLGLSRD